MGKGSQTINGICLHASQNFRILDGISPEVIYNGPNQDFTIPEYHVFNATYTASDNIGIDSVHVYYSNDGGNWKKSDLKFEANKMIINFAEPFVPRRGRINCSLNEDGKWRWFGTQFTIRPN